MKPFISVILTVHNTEKYLRSCLDSLLAQCMKNIEIICVDDASEDDSVAIIKEYMQKDNRIELIELKENKGANYARNLALKKATGIYVSVLDADDFFETNFLEKLYNQAKKTNADITFCGFNLFDDTTNEVQNIFWDIDRAILPKSEVFTMEPKLFDLLPSFVWNQLYNRKFIKENNLSFADIRCFTDVYFNKTALLKAKRISYVDEKLVYYRVNNRDSISHNLTYSGAIRTIYVLADFLKKENLFDRYNKAFFISSLLKMKRIVKIPEPYCGLLRSFYQKHLIHKFWDNEIIPSNFPVLSDFDNCSDDFKRFFFCKREKILPIVMMAEDYKLPDASVTIQSIIEHANDMYFYDIYVIGNNFSRETSFNLALLFQKNIRISCIDVSKKYGMKIDFTDDFSYMRDLFDGYEKILFLEENSLVKSDLVKVFNGNLQSDVPQAKIILMAKNGNSRRLQISKILSFGKILPKDFLWWKMAQNSAFYEYLITKEL